MIKALKLSVIALLMGGLVACTDGAGTKERIGGLMGAAAGGIAGSNVGSGQGRTAAIIAGTLAGAWLGSEIGRSLDRADRAAMEQTTQQSLEYGQTGQTSSWSNPDSGNSGTITPQATSTSSNGQPCREYHQTVVIGGKEETAYGTACREADGSWRIVS